MNNPGNWRGPGIQNSREKNPRHERKVNDECMVSDSIIIFRPNSHELRVNHFRSIFFRPCLISQSVSASDFPISLPGIGEGRKTFEEIGPLHTENCPTSPAHNWAINVTPCDWFCLENPPFHNFPFRFPATIFQSWLFYLSVRFLSRTGI